MIRSVLLILFNKDARRIWVLFLLWYFVVIMFLRG
jgi:hypothetical protein